MSTRMDDRYAAALRQALAEHVETSTRTHRAVRRRAAAIAGAVALAFGGAGVAAATGILVLPGADVVESLAPPVGTAGQGTRTVDLGQAPPGTTAVDIAFTCLTAGTFSFDDGVSVTCEPDDAGTRTGISTWQRNLEHGQRTVTVTTNPDARWRLDAKYARVTTSDWAVNADGLTYGVQNENGTPDLVAVIATNGKDGYVYSRDLMGPTPTALVTAPPSTAPGEMIPVYASDGRTRIGEFHAGR